MCLKETEHLASGSGSAGCVCKIKEGRKEGWGFGCLVREPSFHFLPSFFPNTLHL